MGKENQDAIWRKKVESQLFQIKVMLTILIDLCILGFYGLARAGWDDISGEMTRVAEVFLVVGLVMNLVMIIAWLSKRSSSFRNETDETKT